MPNKTRSKQTPLNKKIKRKNNRTIRIKDKCVWLYKSGNILLCYKVPFLKIKRTITVKSKMNGGKQSEAFEDKLKQILNKLSKNLPDKDIRKFLENKENVKLIMNDILKSIDKPQFKTQFKPLINELNGSESQISDEVLQIIYKFIKQKMIALDIINSIKEKAKNSVSDKDLETIERTLNNENVCDSRGSLTSMTSDAFDRISNNAVSLGKFLTPAPVSNVRRRNDTTIQMLWYPLQNPHYRKGNSIGEPKNNIKYGDFMIYVEPERYADMYAYFSNATNSVEDLFTNILNGCTDSFCMKGNVVPKPYKHQVIQLNNFQPHFDDKDSEKNYLEKNL